MTYRVTINRIGRAGVPAGAPQVYEARDEADALATAAYEVDSRRSDRPHVAIVRDATGRLLLTYSGPCRYEALMTEQERRSWALDDRDAKAIIGFMLALQVLLLLSTLLWN